MVGQSQISLPVHVAVIMDGNGRWAQARHLPRAKGHEAGAESVRTILKACNKAGVKYLTLYAFSVENWSRPKNEVDALMVLLKKFLRNNERDLHEQEVRLRIIGRIEDLPRDIVADLERVMKETQHYQKAQLILALSYGARTEIAHAAQHLANAVKEGKMEASQIDETTFAEALYLPDVPDPDLLIRTSGEKRLSNFLLWQSSYAELYFTDVLWPDFREEHFYEALKSFSGRKRRFGAI